MIEQEQQREEERQAVEKREVRERHDVAARAHGPPSAERQGKAERRADAAQQQAVVGLGQHVAPEQIKDREAQNADDRSRPDLQLGVRVVLDVAARQIADAPRDEARPRSRLAARRYDVGARL
ncbi:MAG: hypothetical protein WDN31_08715 [Hyphomicrobium sp.]